MASAKRDTHNRSVDFYTTPSTYYVKYSDKKIKDRFNDEYEPRIQTATPEKLDSDVNMGIVLLIVVGFLIIIYLLLR